MAVTKADWTVELKVVMTVAQTVVGGGVEKVGMLAGSKVESLAGKMGRQWAG